MNRKGFIFDLDGVIVDTARYHFLAWQRLGESLGISFNETANEQLKGVSRVGSLEKILSWGNLSLPPERFDELLEIKNNDYLNCISHMNEEEILPDVPRVLSYLKKNGQAVALGSGSKNARSVLDEIGLKEIFDAIVDGNDITETKPNPQVFLMASEKLGIPAENCIVFEDAVSGVQAANNAGMTSIGIGDPSVLHEAMYVFKDFTEIPTDFFAKLISE